MRVSVIFFPPPALGRETYTKTLNKKQRKAGGKKEEKSLVIMCCRFALRGRATVDENER